MSQVIKKRRIVLASVLKPVDDTRMFEKIGSTIADNGHEVIIIGYPTIQVPLHPGIQFYMLPAFKRLSWKRLIAPLLVFRIINKVKPELLIINSPELLIVALLNRILFGRRTVYDVLENYKRNIRYTSAFSPIWQLPLSILVRLKERITAPFIQHFLLAEEGYVKELSFAKPFTVLQNKLPKSVAIKYPTSSKKYSKLLFSGTLAESTGVFEVIRLCKQIHKVDPSYTLTIIGFSPISKTIFEIEHEIRDHSYIKLIGGTTLVPHHMVLKEISQADMGIIIYPPNPSTESSIPTKLYEYLALKLPILIRHNTESHKMVEGYNAGIVLAKNPDYTELSSLLKSSHFTPTPPASIYWESNTENLMNCLKI